MQGVTRRLGRYSAVALAAASVTVGSIPAAVAAPRTPNFQMPFPCGQVWIGDNGSSSAHRGEEIDFNRGASTTADLGDTVVAAAPGRVVASAFSTDSGFGNFVAIDHGGGWVTYYAHMTRRAVVAGQRVLRGQPIGAVGNTSKTNPDISPHLHYEVRLGSGYPGNVQPAVFNGARFDYPAATVRSRNCATRYDAAELCGDGFEVNDSKALAHKGVVVLAWRERTAENCAVTLRWRANSTPVAMNAHLRPRGGQAVKDPGQFTVYAGPVRAKAPGCVRWGGAIGDTRFISKWGHC